MGFFFVNDENPNVARKAAKSTGGYSLKFLHEKQCQVCPLNKQSGLQHPYMKATGTSEPMVYILGEAPGFEEDQIGKQFVGKSGAALRLRIPSDWLPHIRWNNTIRCHPPDNRDPSTIEIECCRPFIVADIERSQPDAIFGFGNFALNWAIGQSGIGKWSGRRIPVQVGKHRCWYYAFMHPSSICHQRHFEPRDASSYGCEDEFALAVHLHRAFNEVAAGLPEPRPHTVKQAMENIRCFRGDGPDDLDHVVEFLESSDDQGLWVGMDYEANRLRPYNNDAKLLSCGLAVEGDAIAFALDHHEAGWSEHDRQLLDVEFGRWLHNARCRKISFSSFEMEWSAVKYGRECLRKTLWGDAQSQAYILDGRSGMLSLDALCLQYFGFNLKAISNVDREKLDDTPLDNVLSYNALDAKYHLNLFAEQNVRIDDEGLREVYEHQLRRVPTMVLTQLSGVPVDQKRVASLRKKYLGRLADIEAELDKLQVCKQVRNMTGHAYRPMAEKDIKTAWSLLGHDNELRGYDEAAISAFRDDSDDPTERSEIGELARLTIEWRKANKVWSTYIEPCDATSEKSVVHDDGMLHPIIALHKTRTWRTSSEEPNAQNYPKRNDESKEVRSMVNAVALAVPYIIGDPGPYKVVSFDYSGIQARNVAMESHDHELVKAFRHRYDIHKDWMEQIARRCPYWADGKRLAHDEDYRASKRHEAKNKFVFPTFFGAHFKTIAETHLHVEMRDAEWLQEQFKHRFRGVDRWHKTVHRNYLRDGYVTGHSGFRRYAPVDMNERINSPIQGDEAIIVCDAMNRLSELGEPQYQAMLEIHDDLTFLWPTKKIEAYSEVVIEHMLFVPFDWAHIVPIEIERSIGDDWAALKPAGKFASDTWKKESHND